MLSLLVSIYGSKELFISECRWGLAGLWGLWGCPCKFRALKLWELLRHDSPDSSCGAVAHVLTTWARQADSSACC